MQFWDSADWAMNKDAVVIPPKKMATEVLEAKLEDPPLQSPLSKE
jgi:hypothetical protein